MTLKLLLGALTFAVSSATTLCALAETAEPGIGTSPAPSQEQSAEAIEEASCSLTAVGAPAKTTALSTLLLLGGALVYGRSRRRLRNEQHP